MSKIASDLLDELEQLADESIDAQYGTLKASLVVKYAREIRTALSRAAAPDAAIERVRAIHYPFTPQLCYLNAQGGQSPMTSLHCHNCNPEGSGMVGDPDTWPCPTAVALDGAPEPEWEYGLLNPQAPDGGKLQGGAHLISDNREHIVTQQKRGHPAIQAVRRRKAGPWLPVEGESKP